MSTSLDSAEQKKIEISHDSDTISLAPLIYAFTDRWRWLLMGVTLGALVGYSLSFAISTRYVAGVLVTPSGSEQGGASLASLASRFGALGGLVGGSLGGGDTGKAALIATLTSRQFVDRFIARHQIDKIIFAHLWDLKTQSWISRWYGSIPTTQDSFEFFIRHVLTVDEDKRSGLITISMKWETPQASASWANAFAAEANQIARETAMSEANQSIEHLTREMAKVESVEVRKSMYSLMESQLNKRMLATVRPDYAYRIIDPAVAPDLDKFATPRRGLFTVIGSLVGIMTVFLYSWWSDRRRLQRTNP